MTTELWQRLQAARERGPAAIKRRKAITQSEIAAAIASDLRRKFTRNAVSLWESEDPTARTMPNIPQLKVVAKETEVDFMWLISDGENLDPKPISNSGEMIAYSPVPQVMWVPIRGVAAVNREGFWFELETSEIKSYPYPTNDPDAYAIVFKGDAYFPTIKAGRGAIIEPNSPIKPGSDVLVRLKDDSFSIWELLGFDSDHYRLQGVNGSPRLTIVSADLKSIHHVPAIFTP